MTLLALYLGSLVLGGILVGASMMGGGDGGDHGADADHGGDLDHGGGADHDVDHGGDLHHGGDLDHGGHDHDHGHLPTGHATSEMSTLPDPGLLTVLRSVRFWTFFLAAFGLAGTLLTVVGAPAMFGLPLALVTGALSGGLVSLLVRSLARDTVSTETSTRQLAGREAEVVLALGPGRRGKIRVTHNGQILDLPATTRDDHPIERGSRVLIVEMKDGCADVTPATPARGATAHPLSQ